MTTGKKNTLLWILRLVAAIILLQTLFFKFSAAPVSVYIFTEVGIEPWGRIATGIIELIAAILIVVPRTTGIGALLGLGLMSGALLLHFTTLGIVVKNDSGQLFLLAIAVFISCLILVRVHWKQLKSVLGYE